MSTGNRDRRRGNRGKSSDIESNNDGSRTSRTLKPLGRSSKPAYTGSSGSSSSISGNAGIFRPRQYPKKPSTVLGVQRGPQQVRHLEERVDSWDAANQQKMALLERRQHLTGSSLQALYEKMQHMREDERREMENRGLVDRQDVRKALSDALVFVGTCRDMCPVFERVRRSYENNVMQIERNTETGRVTAEAAVKAFSRPAAGQPPPLPSDVRPPSVLVATLDYLVVRVLPLLPNSHPFLWDRTRSIRQDFTYQNFAGPEAIRCTEVIARIHLLTLQRMAAAPGDDWSLQQEMEQFNKCLQSLTEFYNIDEDRTPDVHPCEPEFRAYQLISHLWDPEMGASIDRLPQHVSMHPLVLLARELRALVANRDAPLCHAFIERIKQPDVPVLLQSLAVVHFNRLRTDAARLLARSLHNRSGMYPLARFVRMLGFDNEAEAQKFCSHFDLIISPAASANRTAEVDMKSWSDANAADKMPLALPAPQFLASRIHNVNVLEPVIYEISKHVPTNQQLPKVPTRKGDVAEGSVPRRSGAFREPFAIAPLFGTADSGTNATETMFSGVQNTSTGDQPYQIAEQQRQTQIQAEQAAKTAQAAQEAENTRKRIEYEKRQAEERRIAEARLIEERRLIEEAKRAKEQDAAKKRAEQERAQQQALRRAEIERQRDTFIDECSRFITNRIIGFVAGSTGAMTARALLFNRKRLERFAVLSVKHKAASILKDQQRRQERRAELEQAASMLWAESRGRVSSRPQRSSHWSNPELLDMIEHARTRVELDPLLPGLHRAAERGIHQIEIRADWNSPHGRWLERTLGLESGERTFPGISSKLVRDKPGDAILEVFPEVRDAESLLSLILRWLATHAPASPDLVKPRRPSEPSLFGPVEPLVPRKRRLGPPGLDELGLWRSLQRRSKSRTSVHSANTSNNSLLQSSSGSPSFSRRASTVSQMSMESAENPVLVRLRRLIASSLEM